MRATWLFAGLLAVGLGWVANGADEPAKETPKPPEGWTEYTPMDKIFTVWIPKGGKRTERTGTVPVENFRIRVNSLQLQSDGKGLLIARTFLINTLPAKKVGTGKGAKGRAQAGKGAKAKASEGISGPSEAQALTEATRNMFLKEVKGKIADEKDIKFEGMEGKEYQVTINSKISGRLRVFVTGHLIHQMAIVGTKEQIEGKDADVFLNSYRQLNP